MSICSTSQTAAHLRQQHIANSSTASLKASSVHHPQHCLLHVHLLQMMVLDGNLYDQKFLGEATRSNPARATDADLDACALLVNNKGTSLLISNGGGVQDAVGRVVFKATVSATGHSMWLYCLLELHGQCKAGDAAGSHSNTSSMDAFNHLFAQSSVHVLSVQ